MVESAALLASKCRPNALNLNFMIIFSTKPYSSEGPGFGCRGNLPTPSHARHGAASRVAPYPKSSEKRKVIAAKTSVFGEPLQLAPIAAADDDVVGLQHAAQLLHDLGHGPAPLLEAQPFQSALADIVFVGASLLVGQMPQFHGCDDAVDDQGGAQPGPEPEKQHSAALVAAERLHGRIVHDVSRTAEGFAKIEPDPASSQVVRLGDHFSVQHDSRIADGHRVVSPVADELVHARNHPAGYKVRPRLELPQFAAAEDAHLHVASADVDGENPPVMLCCHNSETIPECGAACAGKRRKGCGGKDPWIIRLGDFRLRRSTRRQRADHEPRLYPDAQ